MRLTWETRKWSSFMRPDLARVGDSAEFDVQHRRGRLRLAVIKRRRRNQELELRRLTRERCSKRSGLIHAVGCRTETDWKSLLLVLGVGSGVTALESSSFWLRRVSRR